MNSPANDWNNCLWDLSINTGSVTQPQGSRQLLRLYLRVIASL